jgi:hypothetical protein
MHTALLHTHSGLRWILLISFIISIVVLYKASKKSTPSNKIKSYVLFTLIISHIQLIIGLILYFISPKVVFQAASMKNSVLRFYLVEHISLMLIALILVTIGYVKWKKAIEGTTKMKSLFWYYTIALLLILISIPWPFRIAGAAWF